LSPTEQLCTHIHSAQEQSVDVPQAGPGSHSELYAWSVQPGKLIGHKAQIGAEAPPSRLYIHIQGLLLCLYMIPMTKVFDKDDIKRARAYLQPVIQQVVNKVLFSSDHPLAIKFKEYFGDVLSDVTIDRLDCYLLQTLHL
jgi:hypothetical protein